MKVRHYGFMSSNCSVSLADIKGLLKSNLALMWLKNQNPLPRKERYIVLIAEAKCTIGILFCLIRWLIITTEVNRNRLQNF